MKPNIQPIDKEIELGPDEFIVSKTDVKGRITYANRVFMNIAGYGEDQLLSVQHNIVRHPDMPRGVFRFMWQELAEGHEFFGYVKNLCADGSYYWVFANITLDIDETGVLQGYYSVRRKPAPNSIEIVSKIYQEMLRIEEASNAKDAPDKSIEYLTNLLHEKGTTYSNFVLDLEEENAQSIV